LERRIGLIALLNEIGECAMIRGAREYRVTTDADPRLYLTGLRTRKSTNDTSTNDITITCHTDLSSDLQAHLTIERFGVRTGPADGGTPYARLRDTGAHPYDAIEVLAVAFPTRDRQRKAATIRK
jgi:hypothetical protein